MFTIAIHLYQLRSSVFDLSLPNLCTYRPTSDSYIDTCWKCSAYATQKPVNVYKTPIMHKAHAQMQSKNPSSGDKGCLASELIDDAIRRSREKDPRVKWNWNGSGSVFVPQLESISHGGFLAAVITLVGVTLINLTRWLAAASVSLVGKLEVFRSFGLGSHGNYGMVEIPWNSLLPRPIILLLNIRDSIKQNRHYEHWNVWRVLHWNFLPNETKTFIFTFCKRYCILNPNWILISLGKKKNRCRCSWIQTIHQYSGAIITLKV